MCCLFFGLDVICVWAFLLLLLLVFIPLVRFGVISFKASCQHLCFMDILVYFTWSKCFLLFVATLRFFGFVYKHFMSTLFVKLCAMWLSMNDSFIGPPHSISSYRQFKFQQQMSSIICLLYTKSIYNFANNIVVSDCTEMVSLNWPPSKCYPFFWTATVL